jgi:hypothetical protein
MVKVDGIQEVEYARKKQHSIEFDMEVSWMHEVVLGSDLKPKHNMLKLRAL